MPESPLCTMCIHISWDGQAALVCAMEQSRAVDVFCAKSRWDCSHALERCARQALSLAGSSQIDASELSIPWGVDESAFSCPMMARFTPASGYGYGYGMFCALGTAHRASEILKGMLPDDAFCEAIEIAGDSLAAIANGCPLAGPVEEARILALMRADRYALLSQPYAQGAQEASREAARRL